jgi:membrane protease YdiL (CAAX protease family)
VPERVPWLAAAVFLAVSFGLAWLVALPLWLDGGLANPSAGLLLPAMMFTPAAGALAALFVQRIRPGRAVRLLGLWPLRPLGRTLGMSAAAIGGVILVVVLGIALSAAFGLVQLDLVGFSGFVAQLTALGADPAGVPIQAVVLTQLVMLPVASVTNGLFALGEELGWRGWLLPALRPLGIWPALLASGAVWGLWHSPVILLGYNFGLTDWRGVGFMLVGCTLLGVLLGWTRLRTGSVWPAVFGHGAFNATAGLVLLLAAAGPMPPMTVVGPLGAVTWIVMALVIAALVAAGQFRRRVLSGPPSPRAGGAAGGA